MKEYDVVIIGAGIGGYTAAEAAVNAGLKTLLVEKNLIGGTCLNRGCIPTKLYLHLSRQYRELLYYNNYGLNIENLTVNRELLYDYLIKTVKKIRNDLTNRLISNHIDICFGKAILESANQVAIFSENEKKDIRAKYIILATGSCPALPSIPGMQLPNVITSDQLFMKEHLIPQSIAIIGGGVIGIESAFMLKQFGAQVILIEQKECILNNFSKELSAAVTRYLENSGIKIILDTTLNSIDEADDELVLSIENNGIHKKIITEKVLLAIGRKANYKAIGAEQAGVHTANDRITVDENFETSVKGIFAIGDAASKYQLAYVAAAQGKQVIEYIINKAPILKQRYIPQCVYITPEVAVVGQTEESAIQQEIAIQVGYARMSANGRAVLEGCDNGFIKVIIDKHNQCLIGAELFCENAVDMIGMLEICIEDAIPVRDLKKIIFPHPSYSESIQDAIVNALGARSRQ